MKIVPAHVTVSVAAACYLGYHLGSWQLQTRVTIKCIKANVRDVCQMPFASIPWALDIHTNVYKAGAKFSHALTHNTKLSQYVLPMYAITTNISDPTSFSCGTPVSCFV